MITSCNHSATEQLCGSCREKNHRQSILDDKDAEVSSLRARVARLEEFVRKAKIAFDEIGAVNWSRRARRALEEK